MSQTLLNRQIDETVISELKLIVPEYYPKYPYHNYEGHVLDVYDRTTKAYGQLVDLGVDIDLHKAQAAVLLHDILYHVDYASQGYASSEELSAVASDYILLKLGIERASIDEVHDAILATHVTAVPKTNVEKLVRLMDVGNVGDTEEIFFRNTIRFALELAKRDMSLHSLYSAQRESFAGFLRSYVEPPILFETVDGESVTLPGYNTYFANIRKLGSLPFAAVLNIAGVKNVQGLPASWLD
jgi:hypothetical protein